MLRSSAIRGLGLTVMATSALTLGFTATASAAPSASQTAPLAQVAGIHAGAKTKKAKKAQVKKVSKKLRVRSIKATKNAQRKRKAWRKARTKAVRVARRSGSHSVDRTLRDLRIRESTGLARSTYARAMVFTHNDRRDSNRVFVINNAGRTRAVLRLQGASNTDWEDISSGPRNTLWVGDIGDDQRKRNRINVYRFTEPKNPPNNGSVAFVPTTRYDFAYADGKSYDAEALLVHPKDGRVHVVTKRRAGDGVAGVWVAPAHLSTSSVNTLTRIADAPEQVTAGSFSPDGDTIVLSSYDKSYTYGDFSDAPTVTPLPQRRQGESLEIHRDGSTLLVGSEGRLSSILALPVAEKSASLTPTPTPTPQGPATTCVVPSGWKTDLNENFNALDSKVWSVKNDTYASNEHAYLRSNNVDFSGGVLTIQAKQEKYRHRDYTSGYLTSQGKYTLPNYFRAEVRAKVPFEQGMWAAPLWLRPADGQAGEIDLVETYGRDAKAGKPSVHHTIHTEYGSTHKQSVRSKRFSDLPGSATGWHTYTMEKTPGKITLWVDCVKTAEYTDANPSWFSSYYDVGDRWNLRINLQVGGSWGGLPDSTTNWSPAKTQMQVDHVRTWVPTS